MAATSTNTRISTGDDLLQRVGPKPVGAQPALRGAEPATVEQRPAGAALVEEARLLVSNRQWKPACRVLEAASRICDRTIEIDQLLAVSATHAGKRKLADTAIVNLRSESDPSVATIDALTEVALARREFEAADILARKSIDRDPDNAVAWANLAAGFAGLGWFDQADECLDTADRLGLEDSSRWVIGKATNTWALTRTWAAVVAAVLFVFIGLLAVAVGITLPFLLREVRLTQVNDRFAQMAADAWRTEHRLRVMHGLAVLAMLGVWAISLSFV